MGKKEQKMEKKTFWLGMLVLALVFGMMAVGCMPEEEEDDYYYNKPGSPGTGKQVDKPTADPADGEIVSGREIALTSATEYTTIYYTLDGTTPTSSSTSYSSNSKPKITSSCTLKAIATKSGMVDSEILSVSYTAVAVPSFSLVTSNVSLFNRGIQSVAYGNNRFVAGGGGGIAYSTNGTTWTASIGSFSTDMVVIDGITYGTQFVAVGYSSDGGYIYTSSDGASWSGGKITVLGNNWMYRVAFHNDESYNVYVAVGEKGTIAYSSDNAASWTAVTTSTFGTSDIYGIAYGAGKFVAVGSSGKMAYSPTGMYWTAVTDSKFSTNTISGITYGGPAGEEKFVAVSSGTLGSYRIAYSTNGITWTSVPQYFSDRLRGVTWGGNMYVAVAYSGVMYCSLDGTYWVKIEGGTGAGKSQFDTDSSSSITDIIYSGGKFLAVGSKNVSSSSSGEMAISN